MALTPGSRWHVEEISKKRVRTPFPRTVTTLEARPAEEELAANGESVLLARDMVDQELVRAQALRRPNDPDNVDQIDRLVKIYGDLKDYWLSARRENALRTSEMSLIFNILELAKSILDRWEPPVVTAPPPPDMAP